jgi:hypothetical protein
VDRIVEVPKYIDRCIEVPGPVKIEYIIKEVPGGEKIIYVPKEVPGKETVIYVPKEVPGPP